MLFLQVFTGVDICRQSTDPDMKSFMHPVIARFVRIVPLSWEGPSPCLTVELYGCPLLGKVIQHHLYHGNV